MVTQMMSRNWRDLIRPKAIQLDPESSSENYGKFTCEPLERGFGITICNSLRRVLLASLQGAAITAVRLEGALHEFTTIPGFAKVTTAPDWKLAPVIVRFSVLPCSAADGETDATLGRAYPTISFEYERDSFPEVSYALTATYHIWQSARFKVVCVTFPTSTLCVYEPAEAP